VKKEAEGKIGSRPVEIADLCRLMLMGEGIDKQESPTSRPEVAAASGKNKTRRKVRLPYDFPLRPGNCPPAYKKKATRQWRAVSIRRVVIKLFRGPRNFFFLFFFFFFFFFFLFFFFFFFFFFSFFFFFVFFFFFPAPPFVSAWINPETSTGIACRFEKSARQATRWSDYLAFGWLAGGKSGPRRWKYASGGASFSRVRTVIQMGMLATVDELPLALEWRPLNPSGRRAWRGTLSRSSCRRSASCSTPEAVAGTTISYLAEGESRAALSAPGNPAFPFFFFVFFFFHHR